MKPHAEPWPRDARPPAVIAPAAEAVRYSARAGLAAFSLGGGTALGFVALGLFPSFVFLWAAWWPFPSTPGTWAFALGTTAILLGLGGTVFWLLIGRRPAQALAALLTPFMRITVTDRRVLWTLPWRRAPLFEIEGPRVRGAILGDADARGSGAAAIMLYPGDPAADAHGLVHFDRLPRAAEFVDALMRLT